MIISMKNTAEQKMVRITYSKYFLEGILSGLSIRSHFDVPAEVAHERMMELQGITEKNPGREYGSKDVYWVYNVGSEEVGQ